MHIPCVYLYLQRGTVYAAAKQFEKTLLMQIPFIYWVLIAILGSVWGEAFFFAKIAVTEIQPLTLVLLRVGLAALVLWVFIWITKGRPLISANVFRQWLAMGLLANALPFALLFYGQREIGAGLASIINGSTVLWTAVFAHIFLADEKLTPLKTMGIAIGFLGIIIMIGPSALEGVGSNVLAQILVVLTAMSYGFAAVYSRRFAKSDPLITAAGQLTGASLLILPVVLLVDRPTSLALPSPAVLMSLIGLVLISTALAYVFYFKIVAAVGAVNVSLCTFIVPVAALILGTSLLGETLTLTQWLGMAAIFAGMVAIDGRIFRKKTLRNA